MNAATRKCLIFSVPLVLGLASRGTIVNFEILYGAYLPRGLNRGGVLFKRFFLDMGAYSNRHIVLHAITILE